jgi:hypothetical protein
LCLNEFLKSHVIPSDDIDMMNKTILTIRQAFVSLRSFTFFLNVLLYVEFKRQHAVLHAVQVLHLLAP